MRIFAALGEFRNQGRKAAERDAERFNLERDITLNRETGKSRLADGLRRELEKERLGIRCRPKKTRRMRRAVFIPLATADALELDRWAKEPMRFTASRWKQPIERYRADLHLYSPRGEPYGPSSLRARFGRWLAAKQGQALCERWRAWLSAMVARYGWDIDPKEVPGPTIHGLRGTGILARFAQGYDAGQIANDIGATRQRSIITCASRIRWTWPALSVSACG